MFVKTDSGYQNANGKVVASVDDHPDLDELFKRSISEQGYLVYYPVLLKPATFDGTEWEKHTCDETLTVHYTDGSTDTLTADAWSQYYKELPKDQNTDLRQTDGIPVFQFNSFEVSFLQEVNAAAAQMSDAAISMLDLRSNVGGYEEVAHQWITRYSRQRVQGNGVRYDVVNPVSVAIQAHRWQTHDNILILLSGKCSASSAEITMDLAYNLENSLIIGENTNGCMIGNGGHVELPNSKCSVIMTSVCVYLLPEGTDILRNAWPFSGYLGPGQRSRNAGRKTYGKSKVRSDPPGHKEKSPAHFCVPGILLTHATGRIRTSGLPGRSRTLYPAELRSHITGKPV